MSSSLFILLSASKAIAPAPRSAANYLTKIWTLKITLGTGNMYTTICPVTCMIARIWIYVLRALERADCLS